MRTPAVLILLCIGCGRSASDCGPDAPVVAPFVVPQRELPAEIPDGWGPAPAIVWEHAHDRGANVVFVRDDGIVACTRHLGGSTWLPAVLPVGSYRVIVRLDHRCDTRAFTVTRDRAEPPQLDGWELAPGRGVLVRVERNGEPVPGAEIVVDAFNGSREGMMTLWGRADANGRFLLTGLPRDVRSVYAGASIAGSGRRFEAPLGGSATRVVELQR